MDNRHDNSPSRPRSASYPNRPLVVPSRLNRRSQPVIDVVRPVTKLQPKPTPAVAPVAPVVRPAAISRAPLSTPVKVVPIAPLLVPEPITPAAVKPADKSRRLKKKRRAKPKLRGWRYWRRVLLNVIIALLILAAAYMTYDTWRTNNQVKQSLTNGSAAVEGVSTKSVAAAIGDGKDTTPLPTNTLASYKVAADLPRAIYINKLKVAARLLPMGVNKDSSMQTPNNIYDAGWYNGSSKPGQAGAMVVDGHASQTGTHYGLFGRLENLVNGDIITIEKGDGTKINFAVAKVEIVPLNQVDMNQVMVPYNSSQQGLNLITCAGDWTKDGKTLDHRVIVYSLPTA